MKDLNQRKKVSAKILVAWIFFFMNEYCGFHEWNVCVCVCVVENQYFVYGVLCTKDWVNLFCLWLDHTICGFWCEAIILISKTYQVKDLFINQYLHVTTTTTLLSKRTKMSHQSAVFGCWCCSYVLHLCTYRLSHRVCL